MSTATRVIRSFIAYLRTQLTAPSFDLPFPSHQSPVCVLFSCCIGKRIRALWFFSSFFSLFFFLPFPLPFSHAQSAKAPSASQLTPLLTLTHSHLTLISHSHPTPPLILLLPLTSTRGKPPPPPTSSTTNTIVAIQELKRKQGGIKPRLPSPINRTSCNLTVRPILPMHSLPKRIFA
ncbi:hypothetical protein LX32DRAFT_13655 [Colletotrichum zoysiae]|uniref:Uncharacterized protein n=1 Tax=Colletotrichum zoysiae TaxID=1216348 RepID=A0AAD9HCV8_9PEZI|nr:hypothetical protein LX32DRAFT_13655 [Colletotrichum zoysiae]